MRRTKLEDWIEQIEDIPCLTREDLETLQLQRLNETLNRLKARGGFYRNYPDKLDSLQELQTLPFTTGQMLSENPGKFLLTSQSEVSRVISGATSGTTGPAKRVFYTGRDTEHTVGFFAAGISEMLTEGESCLIAFPFSGSFGLGDLIAQAVERLGAVPIRAGFGQSWEELIRLVKDTQPDTYIGFPVTLLSLYRLYGDGFPIKRALVSGDACPKGLLEQLRSALGSKLYPHYGSRECGLGGAVTCSAFEGMHLRENHIIAEIIDENNKVLPEGAYGELVISTIGAEAMPLIRYRTGDYTRFLPPCPCGGVTRRLDTVSRRDGPISMETFDSALFSLSTLVDYQVSINGVYTIEARLTDPADEQALLQLLNQTFPNETFLLKTAQIQLSDHPMYPGKRHIL